MTRSLCCLGIISLLLTLTGGALHVALAQTKDEALRQRATQQATVSGRADDQIPVFLVSFVGSDTTSAPKVNQQATVVSITQVGETQSCPVSVDWRFGLDSVACTTTSTLAGGNAASDFVGTTHDFCTRDLPVAIVRCNVVCHPPLDFFEGKAVISTTPPCVDRIAIDARLYHTTGENDRQVAGIADLKVIRLFVGNNGD
jgi:hypothetical protein